jgi:ABC-type Fe3+ transport system permease subunit
MWLHEYAILALIEIVIGCVTLYLTQRSQRDTELRTLLTQRDDKFRRGLTRILGGLAGLIFILMGLLLLLTSLIGFC